MRIKHYRHFYIALCSEDTTYDLFEMKDIKIPVYVYRKKINHIVETFECILAVIDGYPSGSGEGNSWNTGLIHPTNKSNSEVVYTKDPDYKYQQHRNRYYLESSDKTINIEIYRVCSDAWNITCLYRPIIHTRMCIKKFPIKKNPPFILMERK